MTDENNQDLSAQIRTLFPGDSAAVTADEAIGIAATQTWSATGRRHGGVRLVGRLSPRTIGLRPAIVWGLALVVASIALGVGIGRTSGPGHLVSPATHPTMRTSTTKPTNATLNIGDSVGYQDFDAVSFVNDGLGFGVASSYFSVGESPVQQMLVSTGDGGNTWTVKGELPKEPNGSPQAVFSSASNGFIWVRSNRTIARTDDGGKSWVPLILEAPAIDTSRFGKSVIVVEGDCSKTTDIGCLDVWVAWSSDGGWTWKQTQIPRYLGGNLDISYSTTAASLASSTDAYVIAYGNLYMSDDVGSSWQSPLMEPCTEGDTIELAATESPVPTEFLACGDQGSVGNQAKAVYRRTGGGFSILVSAAAWGDSQSNLGSFGQPPSQTFGYVGPMQAVSAKTVYMVLEDLGVIYTTDGGLYWKLTSMGAAGGGGGAGSVQFVDQTHGWALFTGAEGLYWTTNGTTWTPLDGTPPIS